MRKDRILKMKTMNEWK